MQTGNANVLLLLNSQQTYRRRLIQVVQARAARLADTVALFQRWAAAGEPDRAAGRKILDVGTGEATTVIENSGGP